jgi:hypothetical protein
MRHDNLLVGEGEDKGPVVSELWVEPDPARIVCRAEMAVAEKCGSPFGAGFGAKMAGKARGLAFCVFLQS